jgi:hypothetical protein
MGLSYRQNARAAFRRGDNPTVERMSRDELARARRDGDAPAEVDSLAMLSRLAIRADDLAEADRLVTAALAVALGSGVRALEVQPRHILAAVARMAGELDLARERYLESIALNESLGRSDVVSTENYNLAFIELHLGDAPRARELFGQVRTRALDDDDSEFLPYVVVSAVVLSDADGDPAGTARLLGMTDSAFRAIGQVPDPVAADELAVVSARVRNVLGAERFDREHAVGTHLDVRETLRSQR